MMTPQVNKQRVESRIRLRKLREQRDAGVTLPAKVLEELARYDHKNKLQNVWREKKGLSKAKRKVRAKETPRPLEAELHASPPAVRGELVVVRETEIAGDLAQAVFDRAHSGHNGHGLSLDLVAALFVKIVDEARKKR